MSWRVYIIVHEDSGRVYVGQTVKSLELRFKQHCGPKSGCTHLRRAIQKYGAERFGIYGVEKLTSKADADEAERAWIVAHQSTNPAFGFNIAKGGEGCCKQFCINGHNLDETRYKDTSFCYTCLRERTRAYEKALPAEEKLARSRAKAARRDARRAVDPEYDAKFRAQRRAHRAKRRAEHPEDREKNRQYCSEWYREKMKDPEWVARKNAKHRAYRARQKAAAA